MEKSVAAATGDVPFSSWRRSLSRAVFECALIVFGIVLGLAVNEWREAAQLRRRIRDMRAEFAEEIRANRDELAAEAYAPFHRKLAATWTKFALIPSPTPADRDVAWSTASTGMHPFRPRDAHPQSGERRSGDVERHHRRRNQVAGAV